MPTETPTKAWYTSKAVWGNLVAIAAPMIGLTLHVTITPQEQLDLVTLLASMGASAGGIYGLIGRILATHKLV